MFRAAATGPYDEAVGMFHPLPHDSYHGYQMASIVHDRQTRWLTPLPLFS